MNPLRVIGCFVVATGLLLGSGCYEIPSGGNAPTPVPVITKTEALWVLTIDEFSKRTTEDPATRLLINGDYWLSLKKRGHHYRLIDAANASAAKYQKQVNEAGGLPCVILADYATKKELTAVKLVDQAALEALIAKYSSK